MSDQKEINIHGRCISQFQSVKDCFAENFYRYGEQGAALSVYFRGELVINLWAGTRDKGESKPWLESTRVNIFSASKALVAACVLKLANDHLLDLHRPISYYWSEFGANGKRDITAAQVLSHRAGVCAFKNKMPNEIIFDWSMVTAAVATEEPWWKPGQRQGYSPILYGWVLGELVRRVASVESFDHYFQQAIAEPWKMEAGFGQPESMLEDIADLGPNRSKLPLLSESRLVAEMKANPQGLINMAFTNPMSLLIGTNSPQWRQAQIPAANAHASALSLANFYQHLLGEKFIHHSKREWLWKKQTEGHDLVLDTPMVFSLGFMLNQLGRRDLCFGESARSFGHPGVGGSIGFADPDMEVAFGYVVNRMGQNLLLDYRATRLIEAFNGCLESERVN